MYICVMEKMEKRYILLSKVAFEDFCERSVISRSQFYRLLKMPGYFRITQNIVADFDYVVSDLPF